MTVATKVSFSLDDMKRLKSRKRARFTDEHVKAALKYQLDNDCSLAEAAETQGMSSQTLAKRRDELADKMGITGEDPKPPKKTSAKK